VGGRAALAATTGLFIAANKLTTAAERDPDPVFGAGLGGVARPVVRRRARDAARLDRDRGRLCGIALFFFEQLTFDHASGTSCARGRRVVRVGASRCGGSR
jgi:hypothetical protein